MTRHWIEAYLDGARVAARLVCEDPATCRDTPAAERPTRGCVLVEWVECTAVSDLLDWPVGDRPDIGRLEVAPSWGSGGLTLVPPAGPLPAPRQPRDLVSLVNERGNSITIETWADDRGVHSRIVGPTSEQSSTLTRAEAEAYWASLRRTLHGEAQ